jgi:hypothetical protein
MAGHSLKLFGSARIFGENKTQLQQDYSLRYKKNQTMCQLRHQVTKTTSLGRSSAAKRGAPAHMGHRIAFIGNTAEQYRLLVFVFGCAARGVPEQEQGPMRHEDGEGWVGHSLGDYADAVSRRTKVCLVLVESVGGIREFTMPP